MDARVEVREVALSPPQVVAATRVACTAPPSDRGELVVVLAHGAGSDRSHPVLEGVSAAVADAGHPVWRFNFAYAEAGRRRPDPPARLAAAWRDVAAAARAAHPQRSLLLGGRSMGGRVASLLAAEGQPCDGLVLLGYPLHRRRARRDGPPPAAELRTGHWQALSVPCLFVQGERDALCDLAALESAQHAHLPAGGATTEVIAGADHAFAVGKRDARGAGAVHAEVAGAVVAWLERGIAGGSFGRG
ncbi:MAG: alpha/beta fold hydrolase [Actinomycetota bacterium]